jgi:hypothetical protein
MYGGIGSMTLKRLGLAKPSLALMFDRNAFGRNAISIFS